MLARACENLEVIKLEVALSGHPVHSQTSKILSWDVSKGIMEHSAIDKDGRSAMLNVQQFLTAMYQEAFRAVQDR